MHSVTGWFSIDFILTLFCSLWVGLGSPSIFVLFSVCFERLTESLFPDLSICAHSSHGQEEVRYPSRTRREPFESPGRPEQD